MPRYRIHMINSDFESDGEADYPSLEAARKSAIKTATSIAAESVLEGISSVAVEVQIYDGDAVLVRNVVSLGVSDLSGGGLPS
jgi:hypothetical protein